MSDIITARDLCLWYGQTKALNGINMDVREHSITALIGPSGCGKSTFLKTLNRMNDLIPGVKVTGEVKYENKDFFSRCKRASQKCGNGFPKAQSLSHEYI